MIFYVGASALVLITFWLEIPGAFGLIFSTAFTGTAAAGGFATPVLLSTGENAAMAFFTYLAVLDAGLVVAARSRGWWWLVGLAGAAGLGSQLLESLSSFAWDQLAALVLVYVVLTLVGEDLSDRLRRQWLQGPAAMA